MGNELEGTGVKVLVVDDNSRNVYLLEVLLKGAGYDIVSATNGVEALEKLREGRFDGIVSDILMPGMDGFRLIRECKGDPASPADPLYLLHGYLYGKERRGVRALPRGDTLYYQTGRTRGTSPADWRSFPG